MFRVRVGDLVVKGGKKSLILSPSKNKGAYHRSWKQAKQHLLTALPVELRLVRKNGKTGC
mgnify:CR=1 FL=1